MRLFSVPHPRSQAAARMKVVATLIVFVPFAVGAQDRIEGLVEIPALHSRVNSGVRDSATGPVTLFDAPNDESRATARTC